MLTRSLGRIGSAFSPVVVRLYRPSLALLAKKSKGKSTKDDEEAVLLPDMTTYDAQMKRRIASFKEELAQIRGGSASKDMLSNIIVTAFGSKLPLPEAGQIALKTPTALTISVFDTTMTPFIVAAVRDAGMNLSPVVEGNTVVVNVPKPSKEAREMQIKAIGKMSEQVVWIFCIMAEMSV